MPMKARTAFTAGRGFSLIELVITIVILAIGVSAFLVLINQTTRDSVDPVIRQQAGAMAQSYLDEVSLQRFCDPDFSTDCRSDCTSNTACSVCSLGEGSRDQYDDVCDYDGLADTNGPRDRNNNPVSGPNNELGNYNIQVSVDDGSDGSAAVLGGLSSDNGRVLRIDVRVTHDTFPDLDYTLSGFRVNF